jgi:uncharacterized protein (TIGR02270 family)
MQLSVFTPVSSWQYAEGSSFLWRLREHSLGAANCRLTNLVRTDERVEAHIDALRIAREAGWAAACEALDQAEAGAMFACAVLTIETGNPQRLVDIMTRASGATAGVSDGYEFDPSRDAIGALCWSARDLAMQLIDWLRQAREPFMRAIGVAGLGARRADPGPALAPALSDGSNS